MFKMDRITVTAFCTFVALINLGVISTEETENPQITTPLGQVKGSFMTTRLGKKIYSFLAIRYAEPPVGQRRFQVRIYETI